MGCAAANSVSSHKWKGGFYVVIEHIELLVTFPAYTVCVYRCNHDIVIFFSTKYIIVFLDFMLHTEFVAICMYSFFVVSMLVKRA